MRTCNSLFGFELQNSPALDPRKKEETTKFWGRLVESVVFQKTVIESTFDLMESRLNMNIGLLILWMDYWINERNHSSVNEFISRELKIETFSGRQQLQPDVTSSFVGYCACSCSPPCRRGPDVKLVCLALWRKREYLTFISIRFVAFNNQHFADYRS